MRDGRATVPAPAVDNSLARVSVKAGHVCMIELKGSLHHDSLPGRRVAYRKSRGAKSLKQRRQVSQSWALPGDSKDSL